MQFNEYKSAAYWQSMRIHDEEKAKEQAREIHERNLNAIGIFCTVAIFPIAYCIVCILENI